MGDDRSQQGVEMRTTLKHIRLYIGYNILSSKVYSLV